jgi:hypothetical protein
MASDSRFQYGEVNRRVWNLVAAKYAAELDDHVAALKAGQTTFFAYELSLLGSLQTWCRRAVVLQCSHGQDDVEEIRGPQVRVAAEEG